MRVLIEQLEASDVTDIVSVGIGGSDLGPRLMVDALRDCTMRASRCISSRNVDGSAAQRVLAGLDPKRSAAILISKTFGTQETLLNGSHRLRPGWATTAPVRGQANAEARGMPSACAPERVLPMWDWVGGRYSLWSAVGFPIALALGMDRFSSCSTALPAMDAHAWPRRASREHRGVACAHRGLEPQRIACGHAGGPAYDDRLKLLPAYLQQLVMESLGKSVRIAGDAVDVDTVPVWWGGAGTDTQHSFFQALHQGTQIVPADFIGVLRADHPHAQNHAALLANLLAQTEALANGQDSDDPHRPLPRQPSQHLAAAGRGDAASPSACWSRCTSTASTCSRCCGASMPSTSSAWSSASTSPAVCCRPCKAMPKPTMR
jgi:glucose-6-phosphate isomerase